jgi:predicted metal-dependent peptidase
VKYIKDTYIPVKLTLVLFDTKIQSIFEYNEEDQFGKLKVVGRGGTDLSPIREHMMDAKPTAAIVFSDLYCAEMELGPQCPIIWITVNNPHAHVRMGQLVHITEKE